MKHILALVTAGILGLGVFIYSIPTGDVTPAKSPCRIIYDAGSSGTRLYIYQKLHEKWLEHEGPKVSALADPVREIRGKKWSDADAMINEVVSTLERIQTNGPSDESGQLKWLAFDWPTQCHVVSANIYATAGMRIAEQQDSDKSITLWRKLKHKLTEKLGEVVSIDTRTLTGFEEGLYAWLSVQNNRKDNNFGIVEMGGASSQVTFPCINCPTAKTIKVADQQLKIFSYSFLGLGTNEAPKTIGMTHVCAYGVGTKIPNWMEDSCASRIRIKAEQGIRDPYNFGDQGRGTYKVLPIQQSGIAQWVLTGAFQYMKDNDVNNCCQQEGNCFKKETSCFRAVYFKKYLRVLGIKSHEPADSSWTLGAVICEENNCLRDSGKLMCRWLGKDCL